MGKVCPSTVAEIRERGRPLLRAHWEEIARNKGLMVLAPDWDRYAAIEASGTLFVLGAYDDAGELVGYSVTFVDTHLHYSGLVCATNDVLFVAPEHRGGLGRQLMAETEREATARGARLLLWHAKQGTALDALLPRLGYAVQDIIYSKELG